MKSLAQVIEKAIEKQQAANKNLVVKLKKLLVEGVTILDYLMEEKSEEPAPAKKPRAASAIPPYKLAQVGFEALRMQDKPFVIADIVTPNMSSRMIRAALRQLAAEGKVQQVEGGKWQAVVTPSQESDNGDR